jgi:hypothetical protein
MPVFCHRVRNIKGPYKRDNALDTRIKILELRPQYMTIIRLSACLPPPPK